jgi:predicted Rossmann fold flavoprotein
MSGDAAHRVVVVGGGPAGMMAAIQASRLGKRVVLCEARSRLGLKLLASGGGRCNLTNTLVTDEFMARFGRQGRFMAPALNRLDATGLREFLMQLGVATHAPDGRRVFPVTHQSATVHAALLAEMERLGVETRLSAAASRLDIAQGRVRGVDTTGGHIPAARVVVATGGRGYPALGGGDTGYELLRQAGHPITETFPGMVPLRTLEDWPAQCRADTVPRAVLEIRRRGHRGIRATGDLIFTETGLAGPLVLDVSREITPLLARQGQVPAVLCLTQADEDTWDERLGTPRSNGTLAQQLRNWLPESLAHVLCQRVDLAPSRPVPLGTRDRRRLAAILARTPVALVGSDGWEKAMVTRGGVALRDVDPDTLASRLVAGLLLAGEVLDLDGPCGGFNLQWAFASGFLAGDSAAGAVGTA